MTDVYDAEGKTPNPWSYELWNLTRQGEWVRRFGVAAAERKAREAGTTLGGPRPPNPNEGKTVIVNRNYVMHRRGGGGGGGGGLVGAGDAGDGPPED